jgi:acyl-CoA synthetase (AMP-forming)/AMP-acid ligase II
VGRPDDLKGQALVVFVTIKPGAHPSPELREALGEHVAKEIGKFARPDAIRFTDDPAEDTQRQDHAAPAEGRRGRERVRAT